MHLVVKAMLEFLFVRLPRKKRGQAPLILEGGQDDPERDRFFKKVEEALVIERKYTNLKRDLRWNRAEFIALLNKVQFVKSSFGKSRLQLDMAPEEFKKLKIKIEKALQ